MGVERLEERLLVDQWFLKDWTRSQYLCTMCYSSAYYSLMYMLTWWQDKDTVYLLRAGGSPSLQPLWGVSFYGKRYMHHRALLHFTASIILQGNFTYPLALCLWHGLSVTGESSGTSQFGRQIKLDLYSTLRKSTMGYFIPLLAISWNKKRSPDMIEWTWILFINSENSNMAVHVAF